MDAFDKLWDKLAARGRCDARGGAEYERVRAYFDREMRCWRAALHNPGHPYHGSKMPRAGEIIRRCAR